MTGSVKKDAERGSWYFVIDTRTANGKRRQIKRRGFAKKGDATDAVDELRRQMSIGRGMDPNSVTVADFVERWHEHVDQLETLKPTTKAAYRNSTNHLVEHLGDVRLSDLRGEHLDGVYLALAHRSDSLRRQIHIAASKMLDQAMRWRLVSYNAAREATAPPQSRPNPKAWSPSEVRTFLQHASEDRWAALWLLFATTGMRRGEAVGLRWSDFGERSVTVERSVTLAGGRTHVGAPKSDRSRQIALDPTTLAALRTWRATQSAEMLRLGQYRPDEDWVWTWEDGSWVNPSVITRTFNRIVKRAELPPLHLHSLRHAVATNLLRNGVDVRTVADRLGHSSTRITLDVYTASSTDADHAASDLLESLYGKQNA